MNYLGAVGRLPDSGNEGDVVLLVYAVDKESEHYVWSNGRWQLMLTTQDESGNTIAILPRDFKPTPEQKPDPEAEKFVDELRQL